MEKFLKRDEDVDLVKGVDCISRPVFAGEKAKKGRLLWEEMSC